MQTEARIRDKHVTVETRGIQMPVYCAEPDSTETLPALILIHEIFSLNKHIEDVARRFAQTGLRVFAPDLFALEKNFPSNPDERNDLGKMRALWSAIPDKQLIDDLGNILSYAKEQPNINTKSIGTLGYCIGGAIAFMFGASNKDVSWIVDYYGRIRYATVSDTKPRHPVDYAEGLNGPVLGLFSGTDELIPAEDIAFLTQTLIQLGKSITLRVYPDAPHAFFNDTRETYRAHAAESAWDLTMAFIAENSKRGR